MSSITPGGEFAVNTATLLSQTAPAIGRFVDGGFVIVWGSLDPAQDGADSAIKGQRFDSVGNEVGPEFLVNSQALGSQFTPAIAVSANGNFLVSWVSTDPAQDGSQNAIKAQLFDAQGDAIGGEFLVNTQAAGSQFTPNITALADGRFIVSWDDWTGFDMKAQMFGADGTPIGGEFRVNISTGSAQEYGDIVALADGGFVATWRTTDTSVDGDGHAVMARMFESSGVGGVEFVVNIATTGFQYSPTVAGLSNGGFVISWHTTDPAQDGSGGAIKAQMFDASGNKVGAEFLVNSAGFEWQTDPDIVALPGGGFVISWTTADPAQDGSGHAVKAQAYDASGNPVGDEFLVNASTSGAQTQGVLAVLADGRLLASWVSATGDGSGNGVRARIFTVDTDSPVAIISNGGGDSASTAIAESWNFVTTVAASDPDGDAISYSITGGADYSLFEIDPVTGALWFDQLRDFEAPGDSDYDNIYEVIVTATTATSSDSQAISVTVTNIDERPVVTSISTVTVAEGSTAVATVTATDPESTALSYAIVGGADSAWFQIDSATGALSFVSARDREAPTDADGDNVYHVIVAASDAGGSTSQALAATVGNVDEPLTIVSHGGVDGIYVYVNENDQAVTTVAAADPDGGEILYSIVGGTDANHFIVDPLSGAVSFRIAPNAELPTDSDGNGLYHVTVSASDGQYSDTQDIWAWIDDFREGNTVWGTAANDVISPTSAPAGQPRATDLEDIIYGLGGNDQLFGAGDDDIIDGGAGNDQLSGGTGNDVLTGGSGADRFIFSDTTFGGASPDRITDFSRQQNDRIDLRAIDADLNRSGDQSFKFTGTNGLAGVAGQLSYSQYDGLTMVSGDVDGDGIADFKIEIVGTVDLKGSDFFL